MRENILMLNDLINDFIKYVDKFYNEDNGIYPIANSETIKKYCYEFIYDSITNQKPLYFDSIDRENVRCLIDPTHKII